MLTPADSAPAAVPVAPSRPSPLRFVFLLLGFVLLLGLLWQTEGHAPADGLWWLRWAGLAGAAAYVAWRPTLTLWILLGMFVGIEAGYDFPEAAQGLKVFSDIFLRLVKTIVAPLVLATLVVGIAGHSDLKQVGRMGVKALIYFEVVTTLALFLGLGAINLTRAGAGVPQPAEAASKISEIQVQAPKSAAEVILHAFPENIAKAVAEGQVLQVVVFAVLLAIALAQLSEAARRPLLTAFESLTAAMFRFTGLVMYLAPLGVAGAIAYTVGKLGLGPLKNALYLLLTLYGALAAFVVLVLLPIALAWRVPLRRFVQAVAEPVGIAFATSTSEAALPRAMEAMERLGVPRRVVAFVMPTGYSFNLDGTTLYLSLAAVFVAQAAGVEMTFGQQLVMVFTLMLTSKGVAGVPRASLVILLGTVAAFNLPAWPIFLILGIDALMDMARTAVNVLGNCLATVVVAKWEGEL